MFDWPDVSIDGLSQYFRLNCDSLVMPSVSYWLLPFALQTSSALTDSKVIQYVLISVQATLCYRLITKLSMFRSGFVLCNALFLTIVEDFLLSLTSFTHLHMSARSPKSRLSVCRWFESLPRILSGSAVASVSCREPAEPYASRGSVVATCICACTRACTVPYRTRASALQLPRPRAPQHARQRRVHARAQAVA